MSSNRDGISAEQAEAILQCPICYEVPRAPLLNCQTGHTVCGDCRKKVPNCPLCRQGFTNGRNFIAESLADTLGYRCPYSTFGCEVYVSKSQKDEHMTLCNFRPVTCDVDPCVGQQIAYSAYLDHLKNAHFVYQFTALRVSSSGTATKVRRRAPAPMLMLESLMEEEHGTPYAISCFGHTFLQYTQSVGGKMWFWVSLFGTPEEARRFRVTLTLSSEEKELKTVWTGSAHSVRHCGQDIYSKGLCMVMTKECLKAYEVRHPSGFPYCILEVEIEKRILKRTARN